jgi:hypothetical protein
MYRNIKSKFYLVLQSAALPHRRCVCRSRRARKRFKIIVNSGSIQPYSDNGFRKIKMLQNIIIIIQHSAAISAEL